MKVHTAEQENPDGSLNVQLEDISQHEIEVFFGKGLIATLQEEVDRLKHLDALSSKWMATVTRVEIHRVDTDPFNATEGFTIDLMHNFGQPTIAISANYNSGEDRTIYLDGDTLAMINEQVRRLKEQKGVQELFNEN